jgi:hypothetical protein
MDRAPMPLATLPAFFDLPAFTQTGSSSEVSAATIIDNSGNSNEPPQKISKRPKTGCLTCRLRKKVRLLRCRQGSGYP